MNNNILELLEKYDNCKVIEELIKRITDEKIRKEILDVIPLIALLMEKEDEKDFIYFQNLIEELLKYEDAKRELKYKWHIITNNCSNGVKKCLKM